jgi:SAM-dependent methyltransferase
MNTEIARKLAAVANAAAYEGFASEHYIDGAPHIKHAGLRDLYASQVLKVFEKASQHASEPLVLDLGAGEGSVTMPFLELGCRVIAVDIAQGQLRRLAERCASYESRLELLCQDLMITLEDESKSYDVIVANSLLHHIPDYLALIRLALNRLQKQGQFFSFQDPMRYSTLPRSTRLMGTVSYLVWRLRKGDVRGGFQRWLRRRRGVYLADLAADNAEYHVVRDGVDQDAIKKLCRNQGCEAEILEYFSTQNAFMLRLGRTSGLCNTFSLIAKRH